MTLSVVIVVILSTRTAWAQLEPACIENSPERRGEIGCSLVENKPLPSGLKAPLPWHIDRFAAEAEAKAAVGPTSVGFSAHNNEGGRRGDSEVDVVQTA
jgi:hypothetical protein